MDRHWADARRTVFLVVADHSDNMGFFPDLFAGKPEILANVTGRQWYDMIQSGKGAEAAIQIIVAFSQGTFPKELMYFPGTPAYQGAWQQTIAAAEKYNDPGHFTAFIGYEWTSNTGGNNLHRNVIFRDNADRASQVVPFTVYPPFGSDNPRELWKWMAAYEQKTGGRVLAIASSSASSCSWPSCCRWRVRRPCCVSRRRPGGHRRLLTASARSPCSG
jgi:hypothetical protein